MPHVAALSTLERRGDVHLFVISAVGILSFSVALILLEHLLRGGKRDASIDSEFPGGGRYLLSLWQYLGRRADGLRTLNRLIDRTTATGARDLVRVANAARAIGEFRDANDFFKAANKTSPNNPEVNTPWGEMQLDKGDPDAQTSFQLALKAQAA